MAGPLERVFAAQPIPTAGGRVIAAPFQFWTSGEDHLRVQSVNAVPGLQLVIQARMVDPAGKISAASWTHTPNSDRTLKFDTFALGVGAMLNLIVYASGATPKVGQTFVIVQLIRGLGSAAIVLGVLVQGCVAFAQALAWPGSPIENALAITPPVRTIGGTTPGAGAEVLETVPSGARWQLLSFRATFATSATPATRRVYLVLQHTALTGMQYPPAGTQTASLNYFYQWAENLPVQVDTASGLSLQPIPDPTILLAGDQIKTVTANRQAGDAYSEVVYAVREWLEVA